MNATELWLIAALIAGIVEILVPVFGFVFVSMAAVVGLSVPRPGFPFRFRSSSSRFRSFFSW